MNNNQNNRELTYNEVKAQLARMYNDKQQSNLSNPNLEFSEELSQDNNSNNQQNNNYKKENTNINPSK